MNSPLPPEYLLDDPDDKPVSQAERIRNLEEAIGPINEDNAPYWRDDN